MNLGIYISSLSSTDQLQSINKFVENNIKHKEIYDISIFYDDVAFNPSNTNCGMFNSTDLWSFNGNLIVTSINALNTALKVVNNINIFYYFGWEQQVETLYLLASIRNNIMVICRSEQEAQKIYRLTGIRPIGVCNDFDNNIINLILEHKDEHQANNNDVYQTA